MPKFIDRVATAFVAASAAFIPGFVIAAVGGLNPSSRDVHPLAALARSLDSVGWCLAIIFISIFVFAFPVERWIVKPEHNRWVASTKYLIVFGAITAVSLVVGFVRTVFAGPQPEFTSYSYLWTALSVAAPVAGVTAFLGRAIYPSFLRARKTMLALASALLVLMMIALAVPRFDDYSPVYEANSPNSFYPPKLAEELARGTWDVNEETLAAGTHQTPSGLRSDPTLNYRLTWACRHVNDQDFTILGHPIDSGKSLFELNVTCDSNKPKFIQVDLGDQAVLVELLIYPADHESIVAENGDQIDYVSTDAFVILAPETSELPANY